MADSMPGRSIIFVTARHGAYLGLKWATIVIGSAMTIFLTIVAGFATYLVAFRDGTRILEDPRFQSLYLNLIGGAFGTYVVSAVWSAIIGAVIAVMVQMIHGRNASEQ